MLQYLKKLPSEIFVAVDVSICEVSSAFFREKIILVRFLFDYLKKKKNNNKNQII